MYNTQHGVNFKQAMFVNREQELSFLNRLLKDVRPGPAQLILLYGRRRIGKTSLLMHWANQQDIPHTYWGIEREPAALQRRKFYARIVNLPVRQAPLFDTWSEVWEATAAFLGNQRHIVILDEIPYAAEADPAMLSSLQHAWDHHFSSSSLVIVLCGSQVRVMEGIQSNQSPLFGRLTGQWLLRPLPFRAVRDFFPAWPAADRVTAYAIVGGVPSYLEWLDPEITLNENINQVLLAPGSMFLAEPPFLLYDEVREPQSYLAVLKAIGAGHHTLQEISNACLIPKSHLSSYLVRLQDLRLVERRIPATLSPRQQRRSKRGRYHLSDPYFRFYFRFLAGQSEALSFYREAVTDRVVRELPNFVGQSSFEELAHQWLANQGKSGRLPFIPEQVGSHWSHRVQVDVVGINRQSHDILLGECKWERKKTGRQIITDLIENKSRRVRLDLSDISKEWRIHYAIFSRAGLTESAKNMLHEFGGFSVDLTRMDRDLSRI